MAEPLMEESWNAWKADLRTHWERVTEEDWQIIEADRERLLGALQERYGWSREQARVEFQAFVAAHQRSLDIDTSREESAGPMDLGIRAQPGDVLGLDTDGETTALGDAAEMKIGGA